VAQIMEHKPSATAERHYRVRPLDLLRVHHERLEAWILKQACVTFDATLEPGKLRAVAMYRTSQNRYKMQTWTVAMHPLAETELRALPADLQARFLHIAELLEDFGPQRVGLPHIRPLERKLWEMRMQGRDGIARAMYAAVQGHRLLVLHVFVKKTQAPPRRAIETALKRLEAHQ